MRGLYHGRYIIAVYDKNDFLVEVGYSPKDLKISFKDEDIARSLISKIFNGERVCERVHFIDVLEEHYDIFRDEDKIFLEHVRETCDNTNKKVARDMGVSLRTYYRRKKMARVAESERAL